MRSAIFLAVLSGCGGCTDDPGAKQLPPHEDGGALPDAPPTCGRATATANPNFIVVSRPYTAASDPATTYEILDLSSIGMPARRDPPNTFDMHRASFGSIQFTPDGEVGFVPQEDGTLGVFSLDVTGKATVIDPAFGTGMFYASRVVVDPTGDFAYVVDSNTQANGGGIYVVAIACDGTPGFVGKLAAASTPNGLIIDSIRAFVATGQSVLDAPVGNEAVMLDWFGAARAPTVEASSDAFGDDNAIVGGFALSADKKSLLIGDTNEFSGVPNRVGVVNIDGPNHVLTPNTVLTPISDPEAIATSPFDNVAIVTSTADGDSIYVVDDTGTGNKWQVRGKLAYTGASPMLPGDLATVDRGALEGHVFVAELSSIRHIQFNFGSSVVDLGSLQFGDGTDQILGAIGVTP
jgi:hypothetical protein